MSQPDRYLEALRERVLVFDGAMGTNVQRRDLGPEDFGGKTGCNDYLTLTRPDVIADIHASFLEVGCDVIETASFQSTRPRLAEWGLADLTLEVNRTAAQIARRLADEYSTPDRPRFVAGSMGPTGFLPSSDDPALGSVTYDQLAAWFAEQARGLVEGGADLLLIETSQDILEVKAAVAGIRRYFHESGRRVPIQAQVTLDTSGRMLLGTDVAAALTTLEALRVDVLGINCSTGPDYMREPVRFLAEHSRTPISVIPNAGIPINQDGRACYPLEPEPLAEALAEFVERLGVNVVGGCCGTTPEHLRRVVERCSGRRPLERAVAPLVAVSSGIRAVALRQDPPPLIVGERVNSQGSRRVKRLLLADDYEGVVRVAREQVEGGAHALDVCVALTERQDEARQMVEVVRRLRSAVEAPLMIDTTEPEVAKAALEVYPGRAIINSINLESGRARADRVLELAREHGAAVVALAIDEQGMAHTAERKLAVCRRIYDLAVGEHGLASDALIFDVLTFPVTTGQAELVDDAAATIEGIRRVKAELPGCLTSLGVSNVSFGVAPQARAVLNSVFLYHAVEAGLDLALVHPQDIVPYAEIPAEVRRLADDLIFNRHPDALPAFIAHFEQGGAGVQREKADDPTEGLSVAERIHWQILQRRKEGIEALLDAALAEGRSAVDVLNDILLPAMKDVGDRFGAGELILPFVLQSAEVMKRAVAHLEPHFEKKEGYAKGRVVLATVFGDVHDIGKSLVNTILSNNGYTTFDLGKQVPANVIIEKAVEVGADAIGLSALLVSTSKQMPLVVQELAARGLQIPVLVGGAAINRSFGRRIAFLPDGRYYEPGVFYAKDAFEGLAIVDQLVDPERRDAFLARMRAEAEAERLAQSTGERPTPAAPPARGTPRARVPVPRPPFWGHRVLDPIPHAAAFAHLDLNTLFRFHWGGKQFQGDRYQQLVESEFQPLLVRLQAEAEAEGFIAPRAIYGYYPCGSEGDDLVVLDPADARRELARFTFPRQPDGARLCLADYFRPLDDSERDVVAFQVVTAGGRAAELFAELNARGEYSRAYLIHGLAQSTAEALAEYVNRIVRRDLGLEGERGRRYSWGYLACPDLAQHELLFRILPAGQIGVSLTAGFQLDPEASTAALVVHHPEAVYFSARQAEETRGPVRAAR